MGALVKLDGERRKSGRTGLCLYYALLSTFSMPGCKYGTFVSLGLSIGVHGGKGTVNSERLISLLHLPFCPASFSVYGDPYEQRGERPGHSRPRESRRLIPNELLTEFFE